MAVSVIRVLLVEDSPADARLIREAFSENAATPNALNHFTVTHVARLAEAYEELKPNSVDLILLDLGLPDSVGLDTLKAVAAHSPSVPIVVLTVSDDESWAYQAMQAGAQDYIAKRRLDAVSVVRAVRYAMERKRAELERVAAAAAQAAQAEIDRATSRIRRLQMVTDSALEHLSREEIVDTLLSRICDVLSADASAILFVNPDDTGVHRSSSRISKTSKSDFGDRRLLHAFASRVAAQGLPSVLGGDQLEDPLHSLFGGSGIHCIAGAQMSIRGKLIAVLTAGTRNEAGMPEGELLLLQLIAERIAFVVDHARLYEAERNAKAEALFLNRMKDEFFATMSHELRTPLSAILGWTGLLRSGSLSAEMTAKAVEVIQRNAQAQSALVDDLLDVSRIISGKLRLDVRPVEVSSVIEDAVTACRPAADAKDIRILSILDPKVGMISGDSNRLQQVICNLLANAIKFTPRNGKVEIALQRVNSHLEIIISDTGEGIDPDFLPFVFERFRQASSGTDRQHGGLGIGLSVVKHIVEQHGGTVRAESKGRQQGATFIVKLPISAARLNADNGESHPTVGTLRGHPSTSLDGIHVLVVDDQSDARILLEVVFQQCNARVSNAASAAEALQLISNLCPDVVISDIGMPNEDGYEFIRKLRSMDTPQTQRLPAIALTAFGRTEDRLKSLAAGFDFHVAKPVDSAELVALVARMVRRLGHATP